MLFGSNSESSSCILPAPSGDFTCAPVLIAGRDGEVNKNPIISKYCRRPILLILFSRRRFAFSLRSLLFRLPSFYIVYFRLSKWHRIGRIALRFRGQKSIGGGTRMTAR